LVNGKRIALSPPIIQNITLELLKREAAWVGFPLGAASYLVVGDDFALRDAVLCYQKL